MATLRIALTRHEAITYEPFTKDFYTELQSLKELSDEQVAARRRELNLRCSGFDVPRPLQRFDQARLSRELMAAVRRHGYEAPTPIQCQTLPVALSGRDMIGIAATGSGKTAAFVLPMLNHVMAQASRPAPPCSSTPRPLDPSPSRPLNPSTPHVWRT